MVTSLGRDKPFSICSSPLCPHQRQFRSGVPSSPEQSFCQLRSSGLRTCSLRAPQSSPRVSSSFLWYSTRLKKEYWLLLLTSGCKARVVESSDSIFAQLSFDRASRSSYNLRLIYIPLKPAIARVSNIAFVGLVATDFCHRSSGRLCITPKLHRKLF